MGVPADKVTDFRAASLPALQGYLAHDQGVPRPEKNDTPLGPLHVSSYDYSFSKVLGKGVFNERGLR